MSIFKVQHLFKFRLSFFVHEREVDQVGFRTMLTKNAENAVSLLCWTTRDVAIFRAKCPTKKPLSLAEKKNRISRLFKHVGFV